MTLYRYYCADTECGKHFCLMASDDMEAAYIAQYWARIRGAILEDVQPIEELNA